MMIFLCTWVSYPFNSCLYISWSFSANHIIVASIWTRINFSIVWIKYRMFFSIVLSFLNSASVEGRRSLCRFSNWWSFSKVWVALFWMDFSQSSTHWAKFTCLYFIRTWSFCCYIIGTRNIMFLSIPFEIVSIL